MEEDQIRLEAAQDEWDNVREIVPEFSDGKERKRDQLQSLHQPDPKETPLLGFADALSHVKQTVAGNRTSEEIALSRLRQSPLLKCSPCLQTSTPPSVIEDMRWAHTFTQTPFNNDDPVHFQMLMTLYKLLMGDRIDCPRFGSHWEQIGFQGNDPSTDLRGVGLLGLLQPLFLVTTPELLPLARKAHKVSRSESQDFPLMVLLINLVRITYDLLMEGRLKTMFKPDSPLRGIISGGINEDEDVMKLFNVFFAAVVSQYLNIWIGGNKTIKDSGYVLKDVEALCRKNPALVARNLKRLLESSYRSDEKPADAARRELNRRLQKP